MHAFTRRLVARIGEAHPEAIGDSLIDCAEIMRMWQLFAGDPRGHSVVGPFSDKEPYPHVRAGDVDALKVALIEFIQRHPHHPQLCGAVFGLMKLAAPDTRDLLIEVLRDCLGRDSHALFQTMLALEALGEDLYGRELSRSFNDVEHNESLARKWLSERRF